MIITVYDMKNPPIFLHPNVTTLQIKATPHDSESASLDFLILSLALFILPKI